MSEKALVKRPKFLIISGLAIIFLALWSSYIFFMESNGCKISDIPDFFRLGYSEFINNNYCGEVDAFSFAPRTLNFFLSLLFNVFLWIAPVGFLMLILGIVKAIKK